MIPDQASSSPYAPIRHRDDLWWTYGRVAGKDGHVRSDGRISPELRPMIEQHLIQVYMRGFIEHSRESPNFQMMLGTYLPRVNSLLDWVPMAAQYELCGRQIFDLDDRLVEMFRETDLGECTLESLHLPYEAFFVRFGRQDNSRLVFDGDPTGVGEVTYEYLDGAFVARTPWDDNTFRLKIGFTTAKADGSGVMLPGYFLDFRPDEQRLPIEQAIEAAFARKVAQITDEPGDEQTRAINSWFRQYAEDGAGLLRAGAKLLVNTLFYLETVHDKPAVPEPGRDTPPERVARWFQTPVAKRRKQESGLTADGYAVVRLVGSEVHRLGSTAAGEMGSSIKVHWRRGHWRQQPCGEGLTLRKRIWIKPVMVGAKHHDGRELPGHVYVAEPNGSAVH